MVRICFDYGHGGRDPGAVYRGRKESMDNLSIGMEIAKRLRIFGLEVDEIRGADVTVGLEERCINANNGNYDYFISFHRNAFRPEEANGVETFVYTNPSIRARQLANEIQKNLEICGFRSRGVRTADFYVLKKTKMPALLIEIGFIDNSGDNAIFDYKRKEIVHQISKAIILGTK
ncbi:N-acetylmuramoyl-L-alanine amidase [Tissierella sp.]|uniref:N-acetylmuramoyl-L-alanine amidase n=1 Tax=Tissierella sp. TaxID=41274 RepID=UPI00285BDB5D|nr:N-acetylmuramoyl-L-alanine amidase [Tissierella sp.]MDR7857527.1 N-acetylmuramoyl-L-alanine amidase [Tissierella sp.]